MTPNQVELYERLKSFRFDAPGTTYTFRERLASENGWSRDYAVRVMQEYRRFAFLAVAAGHPVSPSDAVDQAWHLHLVYTRSYWDEFCAKVLRTPFHHEPSTGGRAERSKFDDWYARTLASYRRFFAQDPPPDIWPRPEKKAKTVEQFRRVDVARHWVVPKRGVGVAIATIVLAVSVTFVALGCGQRPAPRGPSAVGSPFAAVAGTSLNLNPFDLRGPEFLLFFAIWTVIVFSIAWALRNASRGSSTPPPTGLHLDPYQIAYLNGGAVHAVNVAIAALYHRDILQVHESDGTIQLLQPHAQLPHLLEQAVHDAAYANGTGRVEIRAVRAATRNAVERLADGLKKAGLIVGDADAGAAAAQATALALLVPAMGLIKIVVGLSRQKPVGFLVAATLVTAFLALAIFPRRLHRTRRGDSALRGLRSSNARLRTNVPEFGAEALVLGVALFGLNFLGDTNLEFLNRTLRPRNAAGYSSSGCGGSTFSCGGSSCGGGGGCGGGGCGGGGCGGCGAS